MRRTVKVLLGAALVWVVVFMAMMSWPTRSGDGVRVTTFGAGVATPQAFRFLMFPKGDVRLRDAPDGSDVGPLSRAVANTHIEIETSGWVRVGIPDGSAWVRVDELAYLPAGDPAPLVDAWRASHPTGAIAQFAPGSKPGWQRVDVRMARVGSSPEDGADWTEYSYETDGRRVDPVELRTYSAKMSAVMDGARVIVAIIFATITTGMMMGTVWMFRRASRARGPVRA